MKDTNELIAEFMGYVFVNGVYESPKDEFHIDEMLYHTSWDWLMPVIDRIKEIRNLPDDHDESFSWVCKASIIEPEYNAVVEFIKQHNKNKKE